MYGYVHTIYDLYIIYSLTYLKHYSKHITMINMNKNNEDIYENIRHNFILFYTDMALRTFSTF